MQVETNLRTPDTPWDFAEQKQIGAYRIEYKDLREFSQGSPLIGFLYINNEQIGKDELFGAPFLLNEYDLYIPRYVRRFCKAGFVLCKIVIRTGSMDNIGEIRPLIYLHGLDDRKIVYYTDYDKSKEETCFF